MSDDNLRTGRFSKARMVAIPCVCLLGLDYQRLVQVYDARQQRSRAWHCIRTLLRFLGSNRMATYSTWIAIGRAVQMHLVCL